MVGGIILFSATVGVAENKMGNRRREEVRVGREQDQVYSVCKCSYGPHIVLATGDIVGLRIQRGLTAMFRSLVFLIRAVGSH